MLLHLYLYGTTVTILSQAFGYDNCNRTYSNDNGLEVRRNINHFAFHIDSIKSKKKTTTKNKQTRKRNEIEIELEFLLDHCLAL
jgi:hypothetical protein